MSDTSPVEKLPAALIKRLMACANGVYDEATLRVYCGEAAAALEAQPVMADGWKAELLEKLEASIDGVDFEESVTLRRGDVQTMIDALKAPSSPAMAVRREVLEAIALLPELKREFTTLDYKRDFLKQIRLQTIITALESLALPHPIGPDLVGEGVVERAAQAAFDRHEFELHEHWAGRRPKVWSDIDETAKQYWRDFVRPILASSKGKQP